MPPGRASRTSESRSLALTDSEGFQSPMNPNELKPGVIVSGPMLPEPIEVLLILESRTVASGLTGREEKQVSARVLDRPGIFEAKR